MSVPSAPHPAITSEVSPFPRHPRREDNYGGGTNADINRITFVPPRNLSYSTKPYPDSIAIGSFFTSTAQSAPSLPCLRHQPRPDRHEL